MLSERNACLIGLVLLLLSGGAAAEGGPTPSDRDPVIPDDDPRRIATMHFVATALEYVDRVGEQKAFHDFSDPANHRWVSGEKYIFCHDMLTGINVAHGGQPKLVGKNIMGLRDPKGVEVNKLLIDAVRESSDGRAWSSYMWPSPVTQLVSPKEVFVRVVHEHFVCGSGYYR